MRCLFVNWNDGHPPSQFSVPDNYTLPRPRAHRRLLRRASLPHTLTLMNDDTHTEMLLDLKRIRSCYLVDIQPGERVIDTRTR